MHFSLALHTGRQVGIGRTVLEAGVCASGKSLASLVRRATVYVIK